MVDDVHHAHLIPTLDGQEQSCRRRPHRLERAGVPGQDIGCLALGDGLLPPTAGFLEADPECLIDCIPHTARPAKVSQALSLNAVFGGANAALVLAARGKLPEVVGFAISRFGPLVHAVSTQCLEPHLHGCRRSHPGGGVGDANWR
ncbi:hypothetical protein ACWGFX_01765 [Streptomyces xanthophaeus]